MPGEDPHEAGQAVTGGKQDSAIEDRLAAPARRFSPRGRLSRLLGGTALLLPCGSLAVQAQEIAVKASGVPIGTIEVIQLAVTVGVLGAALISAVALIRERQRTAAENVELRARLADANAALQRSEALLNLRDQRVVVWPADNRKPDIVGSLPIETGAPDERAAFLAFGRWLMPRSAAALENAIAGLREKGTSFDLIVETQAGAPLDVQGRKSAAHGIVRFVSLSETQRNLARLKLEHQRVAAEHDTMLGLFDALKMPFWLRGTDGRLKWVNHAYWSAVEATDREAALRDGREFLGAQARDAIVNQHNQRPVFEQTVSTVIAGDRHVFSVTDVAGAEGSAGLAYDVSAADTVREEYERTVRSHADTLDQLNTAVAIFEIGRAHV